MTVLEILNQYGFATLASIGMGWFIFFIYNYITKEVSVKLKEASKALISLLDKIRRLDNDLIRLLNKVNHKPTHSCVFAERNVLKILEGDCETAVGAIAKIDKGNINLEAELFSLDGKERFYHKASKELKLAFELGKEVGLILKKESNNSYKK